MWNLGLLGAAGAAPALLSPIQTYDHLTTQVLSSSTPTVVFSNLVTSYASDYEAIELRYTARSDRNNGHSNMAFRFNSDSSAAYSHANVYRDGGSRGTSVASSYTSAMLVAAEPGGTNTASMYGAGVITFYDLFSSSKKTSALGRSQYIGSSIALTMAGGYWNNLAQVDSITVINWDSAQHVAGSRFSLYGIRGV